MLWFIIGLLVGALAMWLFIRYHLDWQVVRSESGVWKMGSSTVDHCYFEIQFSKRIGRFRVVARGYKAKKHTMYGVMVEEANKLRVAYSRSNK